MGNITEINIKNRTYFIDMINIKDFDPNLLKIDKTSYKHIDIYYTGYIKMKDSDYVKINSVNPLHLIKYSDFVSTNKNNDVLKKYAGLWYVIKNKIETLNKGKKGEYDKDFMKTKFDTVDNLQLNKTIKFHMTIVIRCF